MHLFARIRPRPSRTAVLAAALASTAPALPAQTAAPASPPEAVVALEPIVVVAHADSHGLHVVLDPRAPAQPVPAHDGAGVLHAVPGFSVVRKGGTDGDPVFRGMAGSRLSVLLDGENILGGCGNRMDPPTAYVFPAAFDRVTVIKGPQSVVHGPASPAGVVLLERIPRSLTSDTARIHASMTLGSAGRNDEFLEAVAGGPRMQARLAATRTASDDYRDGSRRLIHSRYERWSTHASAAWTPDRDTFVEISGVLSDGEAAYADRAMDGVAFERQNLGLRARRTHLTPHVAAIEAQLFHNDVDHVMDNFSLRTFTPTSMMPGRAVSNPSRETFGARAFATLVPAGGLEIKLGADYQGNRHALRTTSDEAADPVRAKRRIRDASFDTIGVFAEASRDIADDRRLVAGARADLWSATDHRERLSAGMSGAMPNPTAGRRRHATLPSAFIRYEWKPVPATTAYAGVGHAARFPDYWELFSKESTTTLSAFGSEPEHTTQVDVGLVYRAKPLTASVALFGAQIDDFLLIESGFRKPATAMGSRAATVTRSVDARTWGAEASAAWEHESGWRADASIAWVHGTNRIEKRPLGQQPPFEGRLGLGYAAPRWSVGGLARFVGRQDRVAIRQGSIVGQDLGPTPGFAVFSLHAAIHLGERLQLSTGVDNVFDRDYAEHLSRGGAVVAGFPPPTTRVNEPGRTAWMRVDFRY